MVENGGCKFEEVLWTIIFAFYLRRERFRYPCELELNGPAVRENLKMKILGKVKKAKSLRRRSLIAQPEAMEFIVAKCRVTSGVR